MSVWCRNVGVSRAVYTASGEYSYVYGGVELRLGRLHAVHGHGVQPQQAVQLRRVRGGRARCNTLASLPRSTVLFEYTIVFKHDIEVIDLQLLVKG